jgi:thymidine kinase
MNAGKSTSLLQVAHNYEEQGQKVAVYTAAVDNRYGVGKVTSRLGVSRVACVFSEQTDFEQLAASDDFQGLACLLVDESQFLTAAQVRQLHRIAHGRNLPVLCFGLRSDFRGEAFPGAAALLTLADDLEELKTICKCGRKASMNMRVDESGGQVIDGDQVEIGGNNRYRSACPRCFYGLSVKRDGHAAQTEVLA